MWSTEYGDNIARSIQGQLTWQPENNSTTMNIIDELDLLLTQGRLNKDAAKTIVKAHDDAIAFSAHRRRWTLAQGATAEEPLGSNIPAKDGIKMAQMLFTATAEFHVTPCRALITKNQRTVEGNTGSNRST